MTASRSRSAKALGLALLVAGLLAGCGWLDRPGNEARQFAEALGRGETDRAIALSYLPGAEGMPLAVRRGAFQVVAAGLNFAGGVERVRVTEQRITGDEAEVDLRVELRSREPLEVTLRMIRYQGDWKVRGLGR